MSKPANAKGTRDFGPLEMGRRNYIFDTIRKTFQLYGFAPIETPAMELTETLMGKYGEEGDRLIFRILNSGDYFGGEPISLVRQGLNLKLLINKFVHSIVVELVLLKENQKIIDHELIKEITLFKFQTIDAGLAKDEYNSLDSSNRVQLGKLIIERIPALIELIIDFGGVTNFSSNYGLFERTEINDLIIKYFFTDPKESVFNLNVLTNKISEKALRYDLTVPFARFVVQHQNEISFPFKRYQIQPVWRADKPQKGRYREFYQCDADVVGSDSLLFEVELTQIFAEVLSNLNIPGFAIKINNRKVLSGIAEVLGEQEKIVDITVAIDKLDKIGKDGVNKELQGKGIAQAAIDKLQPLIDFTGTNIEKLNFLKEYLKGSEIGQKGIEELEYVFARIGKLNPELLVEGADRNLELDITLARGLNYYTGAIWEVKAKGVSIGSICGGGRYDDLTGIFGLKGISGVGISFGADRIYDVLNELNLFPETANVSSKLLIVHFGEAEADFGLDVVMAVRKAGISAEVYPDQAKMKKQMGYANNKNIPFVGIIGGDELAAGKVMLKNMVSGEQNLVTIPELIANVGK